MDYIRSFNHDSLGIELAIYKSFSLDGHKYHYINSKLKYGLTYDKHNASLPADTNLLRFLYEAIVKLLEIDSVNPFTQHVMIYVSIHHKCPVMLCPNNSSKSEINIVDDGKVIDTCHAIINRLKREYAINMPDVSENDFIMHYLRFSSIELRLIYEPSDLWLQLMDTLCTQRSFEAEIEYRVKNESDKYCTIL